MKVSFRITREEIYKLIFVCVLKWSILAFRGQKSLGDAQIGLLKGFKAGVYMKICFFKKQIYFSYSSFCCLLSQACHLRRWDQSAVNIVYMKAAFTPLKIGLTEISKKGTRLILRSGKYIFQYFERHGLSSSGYV